MKRLLVYVVLFAGLSASIARSTNYQDQLTQYAQEFLKSLKLAAKMTEKKPGSFEEYIDRRLGEHLYKKDFRHTTEDEKKLRIAREKIDKNKIYYTVKSKIEAYQDYIANAMIVSVVGAALYSLYLMHYTKSEYPSFWFFFVTLYWVGFNTLHTKINARTDALYKEYGKVFREGLD